MASLDAGAARLRRARASGQGPIIVVIAPGQSLPDAAARRAARRGPTRGPRAGTGASRPGCRQRPTWRPAAYVSATDMPFLHPAFVRCVVAELDVRLDMRPAPTSTASTSRWPPRTRRGRPVAQELVGQDRLALPLPVRALRGAGDWMSAALLADDALAAADPELESVVSVDDVDAYQRRARAPPHRSRSRRRRARARRRPGRRPVRAATLAMAADSAGIVLGAAITITIDGALAPPDPEVPLADGRST